MGQSAIGEVTVQHPAGTFVSVNTTSFHFAQIGYLHQALLQFPGMAPGETASYTVTSAGETTPAFTVVPDVAGAEKFAVSAPQSAVARWSAFSAFLPKEALGAAPAVSLN